MAISRESASWIADVSYWQMNNLAACVSLLSCDSAGQNKEQKQSDVQRP